jgi:transglutaminase-like putative cysteine protease
MENMQDFLQADWNFDFYHPAVIKLCKDLTEGCNSDREKAVRLFYYVRDECHYNMYAVTGKGEAYQSSAILAGGQGWCLQKAILLTSLARSAGIPSRLLLVSIRNHKSPPEAVEMMGTNLFFPHAYNHLYLNGKWVKAAATFDREICERIQVPAVEFDGENDAVLSSLDLNGQPYIEYVDEYGCFADVPWKLILENARRVYGDLSDKWFKND